MTGGNCSVLTCSNSANKLKPWKSTRCPTHNVEQRYCQCGCPFKLFCFPSKLRNSESRERWVRAMKRINQDKTKWEPSDSARVCSHHFVDGVPTLANPDPSVNLGYDIQVVKPRREIQRKPAPNKRKRKCLPEANLDGLENEDAEILLDQQEPISLEPSCGTIIEQEESMPHIDHNYYCVHKKCEGCTDKDALVKSLVAKINKLTVRLRKIKLKSTKYSPFSYKMIKTDARMTFYTGLSSIAQFDVIFGLLEPYLAHAYFWRGQRRYVSTKMRNFSRRRRRKILSHKNEFLLTLMRLRLGLLTVDLADRFGISPATCSNTFTTWVKIISRVLGKALVCWLPREPIRENMPECFKKMGYGKCRVILDCTEVFIERPKSVMAQATTWSEYKHHNTVKILVGISPNGFITFLSNAYGGKATDNFIVKDSNFLDLLERDDEVMADRGFQIKEDLLLIFCSLTVPPGARAKTQFLPDEVKKTKEIANLRIHVERAINRIKTYRILKSVLPIKTIHCIDDIALSCAALANIKDVLIRKK